jgi:hypothetical protein
MGMDNDGRRDFDFFHGRWRIVNQRLKQRLAGSTEWQEFECPAQECRPVLGGLGNSDNFDTETFSDGKPFRGMTLRLFDPRTRLWSIYWADDRAPGLQPPVLGRFVNGRGEFFGDDTFNGKPIRVKFIWSDITQTSARWEQAFSPDGEKTWETNWRMQMTRIP